MLRKLWNWLNSYPGNPPIARKFCSYSCYEDGGCPICSDWFQWNDPDYGVCGEWRHKSVSDKINPDYDYESDAWGSQS